MREEGGILIVDSPARILITEAATDLLRRLQDRHGPVMFHQSGGCCDGSSPMCYPDGEFIVGDRDILLGVLEGAPVWISGPQFEVWKHTQVTIDVVRFLIRGRAFTPEEMESLEANPAPTGAEIAARRAEVGPAN